MREYDLSGLRALVVDDNRHFLAIMRTMLRAFGVRQIFDCIDAVQAFEVLKSSEIDFALVDLKLENIDGLEFTSLVRSASDSQNPRMPIIMVTAYSERSNVERAIHSGVDEFLIKPVSPKLLYERICSVIERPRTYVRVGGYFGPDRRRRDNAAYGGPERRKDAETDVGDAA
jgi:CheY-like chemotaxis protein